MSKAVETQNLVKKFGDLTAVRGITFSVEGGEILGFLGPNGAGMSITINMLCTLLKVTSGWARSAAMMSPTTRARCAIRSVSSSSIPASTTG